MSPPLVLLENLDSSTTIGFSHSYWRIFFFSFLILLILFSFFFFFSLMAGGISASFVL